MATKDQKIIFIFIVFMFLYLVFNERRMDKISPSPRVFGKSEEELNSLIEEKKKNVEDLIAETSNLKEEQQTIMSALASIINENVEYLFFLKIFKNIFLFENKKKQKQKVDQLSRAKEKEVKLQKEEEKRAQQFQLQKQVELKQKEQAQIQASLPNSGILAAEASGLLLFFLEIIFEIRNNNFKKYGWKLLFNDWRWKK